MRFELIDRLIEREDDKVTAVKSVTSAEEYLADHFPGFPVLPGVLMLEALVQAARRLAEPRRDPGDPPLVLTEARNIKYGNMVRPGQTLRVEVTLRKEEAGALEFAGVGKVDEQTAVQGRFRLEPLNPERQP